mgnify:CR=1 FL=1
MNHLGDYDVIVIGAGHAGIEAAHAAATLGARTAVFTMSLDAIGNMPCNPSIGGTAKGTLVRELDALGGVMGLAADATYLQSRMLNKGKGPAVHALRVQTDRKRYHEYMKHALELTPGLAIHQAEVVGIEVENGHVKGVVTQLNGEYSAKCVVIATGTNLGGKIFVGDAWYASGPDGMHAANALTESLKAAGLPLRRFKTGTPARVHRRSIDFSKLECQPGDPDSELQPFSFLTDAPMHNKVECWIAYTNPETHRIILDNIQRSPLYGGMIEGVGPRYCPSIEDKVVRFAGKDRHPIFVEPCGENTEEMYLQGASSSLPEDVQNAFYRSIKGFSNAPEDGVAQMQFELLRQHANAGESFVVLGRCAEEVLADREGLISIFVRADLDFRVKRTPLLEEEALDFIKHQDRQRRIYHDQHCKGDWGDAKCYDLVINSARLDIPGTVDILEQYIRSRAAQLDDRPAGE